MKRKFYVVTFILLSTLMFCKAQSLTMGGSPSGAEIEARLSPIETSIEELQSSTGTGGGDSTFVYYFSAQHGTSGWQGWSVEGANAHDWTTTYGAGDSDPTFTLTKLPLKVAKDATLTTVYVSGVITSGSGSQCETEIWKIDWAGGETTVTGASQIAGGTYSTSAAGETVTAYLTITDGDLSPDEGFYIVTRRVSGTGTPYLSFTLIFNE